MNAFPRALPAAAAAFAIIASGFRAHVAPQEAGGAWHGITGFPGATTILSALVAALMAWTVSARVDLRPLVVLFAAALKFVPALTGWFHALLVFEGETMALLACVALGVAASRHAVTGGFDRALGRVTAPVVFATALALFVLAGQRLPGPAGPQGDEPHYLLISESLVTDADVNLQDEWNERAYARFTPAPLEPHRAPRSPSGTLFSIHTAGLPALVAPGYVLGAYAGARAVVSVVVALAVALTWRAAARLHGSRVASGVAAALILGTPLPVYANALYPDSVAVLAVAAALDAATGGGRAVRGLFFGTLVLLPWLHPRFLPAGVALVALVGWSAEARVRTLVLGTAALLAGTFLLLLHFQAAFGVFSLSAAYGPGFEGDVTLGAVPTGLGGLLFDRQFGWLLFAPVLLLSAPGAVVEARRAPVRGVLVVAVAASVLLVGAAFSMWWGGASPPARFTIAATPALALLAAACASTGLARLLPLLAGFGVGVLVLALEAPRTLHNRPDGESGLLRRIAPALNLEQRLPSFLPPDRLAPEGPLVDPLGAGARLIAAWNDARRSFGGHDRRDAFAFDLPLGGPATSWNLTAGQEAVSPRFSLPPGRWTLEVAAEAAPEEGVLNAGEVQVLTDDGTVLGRAFLRVGEPRARVTFEVGDRDRRQRVLARGTQSRVVVGRLRARPGPGA